MKIFAFSCTLIFTAILLENGNSKFLDEKLKLSKNKMANFAFSAEQSCEPSSLHTKPSHHGIRGIPVDRDDFSMEI